MTTIITTIMLTTTILDDFLIRAGLAALGTSLAAGLLGCFVVWRRLAYFGEATAHAAVLGVALALAFSVSIFAGVVLVALAMGLLFNSLEGQGSGADALLGVLAHGALAIGLVSITFVPGVRINLDSYLFGDVLTVGKTDLAVIWGGAAAVVLILVWRWNALLTSTLNPDLAIAAGLNPKREALILTLLLATVVAVAIKVVGALLITALLIIPASTAQRFSKTPEGMAALAMSIGALSAIGGLQLALIFDTPVGPTIVATAAGIFALGAFSSVLTRIGG